MKELVKTAQHMRKKAKAPYSNYTVGAALLTIDDEIFTGCNVESASYSLTCCAERVAIFKAISEGYHSFKAIAIATENGGSPCGACRQVLWEQCGDIPVFTVDQNNQVKTTSTKVLLPNAFDDQSLMK
ncbi:MAG: cytidine deaminase [Candidatus Marinimicrobia bacterium]|nr:cytidine deaminase [Candidatus Neomarinimicrobiota bacterium]